MDTEQTGSPPVPHGMENRLQVDNALRAIHQKKPVPEIDFTLHTMEDGTQVSTMERVCKGIYLCPSVATGRSCRSATS
jgi:hypothetical protein